MDEQTPKVRGGLNGTPLALFTRRAWARQPSSGASSLPRDGGRPPPVAFLRGPALGAYPNPAGMAARNGDEIQRGYVISGRVQGVGFRHWTTRSARELGLRGTVRNRADGRVELHAAGPEEELEVLEERLEEGPRAARVRDVEPVGSDRELPDDFRVVR